MKALKQLLPVGVYFRRSQTSMKGHADSFVTVFLWEANNQDRIDHVKLGFCKTFNGYFQFCSHCFCDGM